MAEDWLIDALVAELGEQGQGGAPADRPARLTTYPIKGTIDVEYEVESSIGLLVPIVMHERYEIRRDQSRVDGEATYSRFRQFQVKVDEKLAPVVKP